MSPRCEIEAVAPSLSQNLRWLVQGQPHRLEAAAVGSVRALTIAAGAVVSHSATLGLENRQVLLLIIHRA